MDGRGEKLNAEMENHGKPKEKERVSLRPWLEKKIAAQAQTSKIGPTGWKKAMIFSEKSKGHNIILS